MLAVFGAMAGRAQPQRARGRELRRGRAGGAARHGRARLRVRARPRLAATTTACCRSPSTSARRSPPPTSSSRAPGGTVWELAAAGQPAVLVPYPFATADHQTQERRYFAAGRRRDRRAGAGARPRAGPRRARCSATRERLARWRRRCARLARPDAADEIAEELIALAPLEGRRSGSSGSAAPG